MTDDNAFDDPGDDAAAIMAAPTEFDRTEALEALLRRPDAAVPPALGEFLEGYETRDVKQAALVGLILLRQRPRAGSGGAGSPIALYARMFPALRLYHESELRRAVATAMPATAPLELYDRIAQITYTGDPASADYHYAYQVLATVDPSTVADDWNAYL